MRALKHFNVIKTIISFYLKNWKNKSKRGFKLIYYCLLYIFMLCDIIILLFKFKVFGNKKFLLKIFDFVDKVWIVQNTLGIMDTLVETARIKNEKKDILIEINKIIPFIQGDKEIKKKSENKKDKIKPFSFNFFGTENVFDDLNLESFDQENNEFKIILNELLEKKKKLDSQLIIQSKYVIKLLAEIFLAIGFMYSKAVGEGIIGLSGSISAISVF